MDLRSLLREAQNDFEAAFGVVAGADLSVHLERQATDQRQADPRALGASSEFVFAAVEGIEDVRAVLTRHAGPEIANADPQRTVLRRRVDIDTAHFGVRRVFERVIDQIEEDLLQRIGLVSNRR